MSSNLYRWSQNGAQLLGYVYSKSLHLLPMILKMLQYREKNIKGLKIMQSSIIKRLKFLSFICRAMSAVRKCEEYFSIESWGNLLGLYVNVLVGGGYSGGFCEKLVEASPMSSRANASWL